MYSDSKHTFDDQQYRKENTLIEQTSNKQMYWIIPKWEKEIV